MLTKEWARRVWRKGISWKKWSPGHILGLLSYGSYYIWWFFSTNLTPNSQHFSRQVKWVGRIKGTNCHIIYHWLMAIYLLLANSDHWLFPSWERMPKLWEYVVSQPMLEDSEKSSAWLSNSFFVPLPK